MNKTLDIASRDFDGLCFVNLVDFDMLYGHRRDIPGYARALSEFDAFLPSLISKLGDDDVLIITADHGNSELMIDPATGGPFTAHTTNPVPFILVGKDWKGAKLREDGILADIAPTMLDMMDLPKPKEMEGTSMIVK